MAPIKEWFGLYNVIFNWFEEKYGENALEEYWQYIAASCYSEVEEIFRHKGLEGIRDYFNETFDMDDGKYVSELKDDCLVYKVVKCPDYEFMNSSSNPHFKAIGNYCKHHEIINSIISKNAGYKFRMTECNGKGQCTWKFENLEDGKKEVSITHDNT